MLTDTEMATSLPETMLQFGSGKFVRAFVDLFVHQANEEGQQAGRVVVVQTTGSARSDALARQQGRYHVLVRGLQHGSVIDRVEGSASISRSLAAATAWADVRRAACAPELRWIVSNTAETGYDLNPNDRVDREPPAAFPAKLLVLLKERFEAGRDGVAIVPCELFEQNADKLLGVVLQLARSWELSPGLLDWLKNECRWLNSLVDRIVVDPPLDHPLRTGDELLCATEPFALWAVEDKAPFIRHQAIRRVADVRPFFLRKVRILNAAHTALVAQALPRGIETVRQAVLDPDIGAWLTALLFEEIVPVLQGRVEDPRDFAEQTLERFKNPFLEHRLRDIALYHEAKIAIRLRPTREEFVARFGRTPHLLDEALAAPLPHA